jgi:hypothetical protein
MFGFRSKRSLRKEIIELKQKVSELYKLQFREGDLVYVNDGHNDPRTPVYLISSYNNGNCYYTSKIKDCKSKYLGTEVHVKHISHDPPKTCSCCQQLLKGK